MANLVKKPVSEWDALQTWAAHDKEYFLKLEFKETSHVKEIALREKPTWFGRTWEIIRSFFGFSTLESVARRALDLAQKTDSLSPTQQNALKTLAEKIRKFNARPRWRHPVAIPNDIVASLSASFPNNAPATKTQGKKQGSPKRAAPTQKRTLPPQERLPPPPSDVTQEELDQAREVGDVSVPLAGKLHCAISDIFSSSGDKAATNLLGTVFTGCKIKGDGHCMFRSIALTLLDHYAKNPAALLALVRKNIASMKDGPYAIAQECQKNIEISLTALQKGEPIDEMIRNRALSNAWVLFLRRLAAHSLVSRGEDALYDAANHMATELNDKHLVDELQRLTGEVHMIRTGEKEPEEIATVLPALADCQKEIASRYLSAKVDMSGADASYGTNLELVSLSRALGLPIVTVDVTLSAANKQFAYNSFPGNSFTSSDAPPPAEGIFLLFRGNHYNALFHK